MTERLSNKKVNIFGFYLFTSSLAVMIPMTYLNIFMTDHLMIPAAIVASGLLLARIIDFVMGVAVGGFIEKIHLKNGKYRSWLLVGRWVILVGVIGYFFDSSSLPIGGKITISVIAYLLLNIGMSFTTNAYYGLIPGLAGSNPENRFRLTTRGAQAMSVAMLVTSAAGLPLITALGPVVGENAGYLIAGIVFAIPYIIGCQMCSNICKEIDPPTPKAAAGGPAVPGISLGDMVKSVFANGQLLVLVLVYTIYYTGMYIIQGVTAYFFTYVLGNFQLMTISMTTSMIVGFLSSLCVPKIGQKLGKKRALIVALTIYALGGIAVWLFGSVGLVVYIIIVSVQAASAYLFTGFGANYFIDAGEYYLYKTGKDARLIAITMYSLPMKIGMALGGAISVYGLAVIGYKAGMTMDAAFVGKFMMLMGLSPAVLTIIAVLIMGIGYKISDKDADMYAAENAKKAAAGAEPAK